MIEKHEQKKCPRCQAVFTCKVGDIARCQCSSVELSPESVRYLEAAYFDCLCKDCLSAINQQMKLLKPYKFPGQKEMLVEGLHYYKEGGNWVFTELYHLLRGHCCNNRCRHCPYGFK